MVEQFSEAHGGAKLRNKFSIFFESVHLAVRSSNSPRNCPKLVFIPIQRKFDHLQLKSE